MRALRTLFRDTDRNRDIVRMMNVVITLLGLFGIFVVAILTVFFAVTAPVSKPGPVDLIMMAANGLPFLFYVLFTLKKWPKKLGMQLGIPLHLIWLLPVAMSAKEGNFEIPLVLIASLVVYVFYVRSMPEVQRSANSP